MSWLVRRCRTPGCGLCCEMRPSWTEMNSGTGNFGTCWISCVILKDFFYLAVGRGIIEALRIYTTHTSSCRYATLDPFMFSRLLALFCFYFILVRVLVQELFYLTLSFCLLSPLASNVMMFPSEYESREIEIYQKSQYSIDYT